MARRCSSQRSIIGPSSVAGSAVVLLAGITSRRAGGLARGRPLLALTAVAIALTCAGLAGFRRRDIG
jgi:hypothetical protein